MFVMGRGFFSLTLLNTAFSGFRGLAQKKRWEVQRWNRRPHRSAVHSALEAKRLSRERKGGPGSSPAGGR